MNVYCPSSNNIEPFLVKISQKIKPYLNCQIVQISELVDDDRVDLSIGAQNDQEALKFLIKNQQIKIDTQRFGIESYKPIVSNAFKIYIAAHKQIIKPIHSIFPLPIKQLSQLVKSEPQRIAYTSVQTNYSRLQTSNNRSKELMQPSIVKESFTKNEQSPYSSRKHSRQSRSYSSSSYSSSNSSSKKYRYRNKINSNHSSDRSRSRSKSQQKNNIAKVQDAVYSFNYSSQQNTVMVKQIWIFCIPLQYDEKDVEIKLKQKRIFPQYSNNSWRMIQDMEYLQVQLQRSISIETVQNMELKFGKYSCVVFPRLKNQNEIYEEMKKYQTQLISQNPIDQQFILKSIIQVGGGIITLIKDDYRDDQKYIFVFNTVSKVKIFQQKGKQVFTNCNQIKIGPPTEPLRLCRCQRMFSIQNILNDYAEKVKLEKDKLNY